MHLRKRIDFLLKPCLTLREIGDIDICNSRTAVEMMPIHGLGNVEIAVQAGV